MQFIKRHVLFMPADLIMTFLLISLKASGVLKNICENMQWNEWDNTRYESMQIVAGILNRSVPMEIQDDRFV